MRGAGWCSSSCPPTALWVAFPLYFLQLHLLPARWGAARRDAHRGRGHRRRTWRTGSRSTPGAFIGPLLGAAVAVATVLGYQALYRESERRRHLIEELIATRAELAAAERTAGTLAERERLAREIHDTLAQGLSSIQLLLRAAQRALPAESPAAPHIEQARAAAAGQPRRGPPLRTRPVPAGPGRTGRSPAALERLCATAPGLTGPLHGERHAGRAADAVRGRAAADRAVGARQHRAARAVRAAPRSPSASWTRPWHSTSSTTARGFDPASRPGRTTAASACPRCAHAPSRSGGTFTVESAPGQGTAVAVTLPLPAPASAGGRRGRMTIRLLLADDHPVVRAGLRAVLDAEPDFEVVAEAATAEGAVELRRGRRGRRRPHGPPVRRRACTARRPPRPSRRGPVRRASSS